MAKKRVTSSENNTPNSKLETFAEDLGRLLGTAENKARGWLDQRKAIGGANVAGAVGLAKGIRRGRQAVTAKKVAKKRGGRRTFTAEQRKQQAERMRAYWAAKRSKATKKVGKNGKGGEVGKG